MEEERFRKLWQASSRVHRAATLDSKIAATAEEMRELARVRAVRITTYLFDGVASPHPVVTAPDDSAVKDDEIPVLCLEMSDGMASAFGRIDLYADAPLDADSEELARMYADSAAFAIAHRRVPQFTEDQDDYFRQMVEIAHEGIWMVGRDDRAVYVNQALADMLGYERQALIGQSFHHFMTEEESAISRKIIDAQLVGKLGAREIELHHRDGSKKWVRVSGAHMKSNQGESKGFLGVVVDITERKRTEDVLRNKQAALESALDINSNIIDSAFDVVCVIDKVGRFVSVSRRARDVWGYEPSELIGQRYVKFLSPEFVETSLSQFADFKEGKVPPTPLESFFRCKTGQMIPMAASASWSDRHELFFVFLRDLTAQKEIEARLEQVQRLEAIGQLTGGVAHDFNNLLTVILGNADALADRLNDDQSSRLLAEMTRTAAQRGADLTNRLLAFARLQPLEPKTCNIPQLLHRMGGLMRRMIDDNIEIEFEEGDNLHKALIDASQLEAAILNIAVNARDAMPDGGCLLISISNAELREGELDLPEDVKPGHFVKLMISDTGCGMAPEVMRRAFEPFFTTKSEGESSGLGLSMVYGFVRQSGGHIHMTSSPGEGTCVTLFLPVSELAEAEVKASSSEDTSVAGAELILLVEDNDLVRSFVEGQLESLGYRVIAVENGARALEVLQTQSDIGLLFTDVVMPGGLNGRELADEARKLRSDIKVLFTSGYSEDAIVHDGRLDEGVQLLAKPYKRRELADKVKQALESGERV